MRTSNKKIDEIKKHILLQQTFVYENFLLIFFVWELKWKWRLLNEINVRHNLVKNSHYDDLIL